MLKKIIAFIMSAILIMGLAACDQAQNNNSKSELPEYDNQEFNIMGLWAPYDVSEEGFKLYKDAGFNVLSFTNHSEEPRTSDNQYYLGSNRTMKALELCKKVGLDAYIAYEDTWFVRDIEGDDYFDGTPFTNYDFYGEYKDIIKGVHMKDEPNKEEMDKYSDMRLINDFKKVYPNTSYIVNLTPQYAGGSGYGFATYDELIDYYAKSFMEHFEKPYISVGYYPFPNEENRSYPRRDDWVLTYEKIANLAKEYNAEKTMILQSSVSLEFAKELSEADMRLQVNMALAFGVDNIQYYCYSVPKGQYYYDYCIVDRDNKPSVLYEYLQGIHKEIQSFSDAILSYEWDSVIGSNPVGFSSNMDMSKLLLQNEFKNTKHFENVLSSTDLVMSRFISEKYGEAYMLVNYAQRDVANNVVTVTFKDCEKVAVYGGKGFDGTPKIVELDEENKYRVELEYGDGVFVVPLV